MTKVLQELHVYNSAFEINNEDITKLNLSYEFGNFFVVHYKDGKKDREEVKPCITFEITGKTKDNKDVWFEFELQLGLDELNKYSKKPVDVSKFIFFDGPALQIGDEPHLFFDFRYAKNDINDMYRKLAEAKVFKKEKNIFIIKLFMPEDNLFIHFEVDFNEKDGSK